MNVKLFQISIHLLKSKERWEWVLGVSIFMASRKLPRLNTKTDITVFNLNSNDYFNFVINLLYTRETKESLNVKHTGHIEATTDPAVPTYFPIKESESEITTTESSKPKLLDIKTSDMIKDVSENYLDVSTLKEFTKDRETSQIPSQLVDGAKGLCLEEKLTWKPLNYTLDSVPGVHILEGLVLRLMRNFCKKLEILTKEIGNFDSYKFQIFLAGKSLIAFPSLCPFLANRNSIMDRATYTRLLDEELTPDSLLTLAERLDEVERNKSQASTNPRQKNVIFLCVLRFILCTLTHLFKHSKHFTKSNLQNSIKTFNGVATIYYFKNIFLYYNDLI